MAALQAGGASDYNGAVCRSLLRLLCTRAMSMLLSDDHRRLGLCRKPYAAGLASASAF